MNNDDIFRLALVGISLVFMPIGLYFRIRTYTGEKIDRGQEGLVILFGLRISALILCGVVIAWLIEPAWIAWSSLMFPVWLRWIGVVISVFAASFWVWTVRTLGANLTDTVVTRKEHTLVTGGPYRWVRHPFYTACLFGLLGVFLLTTNWFILALGCLFWFAFLVPRTRIEEQNLLARFGDDYRRYMHRTGRFLPRLRR